MQTKYKNMHAKKDMQADLDKVSLIFSLTK